MKKLTKTFLSVAAVSALTAAMAASASAMTAEYVEGEVNTVALSDVANSGASQTMIILNENADVVTEGMVEAIDQKDDGTVFASVPVEALEDGKKYYVRIGGTDGSMQTATFTVGGVTPSTRLVGDTDNNSTINATDAAVVLNHVAKTTVLTGESLQAADADDNASVNATDAAEILNYVAKTTSKITEGMTISDKVNTVPEG